MDLNPSQPITNTLAQSSSGASFIGAGLGGRSGAQQVLGYWCVEHDAVDPISAIEQIIDDHTIEGCSWALMLIYELGGSVEPRAKSNSHNESDFPMCVLMQLGGAADPVSPAQQGSAYTLGSAHSLCGRDAYLRQVERVKAYIAAGDIYQANIAHHLSASFTGDPIACANDLVRGATPRYGVTMRFSYQGMIHTICSVSPELFIRVHRENGQIQSEPMKGTRPIDSDAAELERNEKDRAELNMITDLMRNDIGRVCTLGSVRVRDARKIEPHPSGVIQASSIVEGTLRDGVGIEALIRAIFPPGSVTGAPKVRAMQIIDELEQRPRGPYCGSIMHIDPQGNIEASVAIRTAHIWGEADPERPGMIRDGQLVYPVGAGIVADSDPASEWDETLVKASILQRALGIDLTRLG